MNTPPHSPGPGPAHGDIDLDQMFSPSPDLEVHLDYTQTALLDSIGALHPAAGAALAADQAQAGAFVLAAEEQHAHLCAAAHAEHALLVRLERIAQDDAGFARDQLLSSAPSLSRPVVDSRGRAMSMRAYLYAFCACDAAAGRDYEPPTFEFSARLVIVAIGAALAAGDAGALAPESPIAAIISAAVLCDSEWRIKTIGDDSRIVEYTVPEDLSAPVTAATWKPARIAPPILELAATAYYRMEREARACATLARAELRAPTPEQRRRVLDGTHNCVNVLLDGGLTPAMRIFLETATADLLLRGGQLEFADTWGVPDPQCTALTALMSSDLLKWEAVRHFMAAALVQTRQVLERARGADVRSSGDAELAAHGAVLLLLYAMYQEHETMRDAEDRARKADVGASMGAGAVRTPAVPLMRPRWARKAGNGFVWTLDACLVHASDLADELDAVLPTVHEINAARAWYRVVPAIIVLPGARYGVLLRAPGAAPVVCRCADAYDAMGLWFSVFLEVCADEPFVHTDTVVNFGAIEAASTADEHYAALVRQMAEGHRLEAERLARELDEDRADRAAWPEDARDDGRDDSSAEDDVVVARPGRPPHIERERRGRGPSIREQQAQMRALNRATSDSD